MVDYSKIPQELKKCHSWLAAKLVVDLERVGKTKKLPLSAKTGKPVGWNRPENLSFFDEAVAYCESHPDHVLGFSWKGTPYGAFDIDNAFDEMGQLKQEVLPSLEKFGLGF